MKQPRKSRAIDRPLITLTPEQAFKVHQAIHDRCEESGACLLWSGACSVGTGSTKPQPAMWLDGKTQPLRRLAYVAYGKELFAHWRISTTCGNDLCLCEAHLKRKSHSESLKGHRKSLLTAARIALSKQSQSPLDWEKVGAIRASEKTDRQLEVEYGVHRSTISKVRRNLSWRQQNPFQGLGAR